MKLSQGLPVRSTARLSSDQARRIDLYKVHGERVPSVTEILKLCGLSNFSGIAPDVLENARRRGVAVHAWTEMLDQGFLAPTDSPDEEIAGYVAAYLEFKEKAGFEITHIEHVVVSESYRYAGTLDRAGYLRNLAEPQEQIVLDIKNVASVSPSTRLQLAGYSLACDIKGRASLQLRADGTYRLARYRDDHDTPDWLSCVRVAHFQLRHGMAHHQEE